MAGAESCERSPRFLAVAENDRCRPEHGAGNEKREIGDKKRQKHERESAKHRRPIAHPFAVSEHDETKRAENNASDTVHREHVGHNALFVANRRPNQGRAKS